MKLRLKCICWPDQCLLVSFQSDNAVLTISVTFFRTHLFSDWLIVAVTNSPTEFNDAYSFYKRAIVKY